MLVVTIKKFPRFADAREHYRFTQQTCLSPVIYDVGGNRIIKMFQIRTLDEKESFEKEAILAKEMSIKNIGPFVHGVFTTSTKKGYVLMERYSTDLMETPPKSWDDVKPVLLKLACSNVIHIDIKPLNIVSREKSDMSRDYRVIDYDPTFCVHNNGYGYAIMVILLNLSVLIRDPTHKLLFKEDIPPIGDVLQKMEDYRELYSRVIWHYFGRPLVKEGINLSSPHKDALAALRNSISYENCMEKSVEYFYSVQ